MAALDSRWQFYNPDLHLLVWFALVWLHMMHGLLLVVLAAGDDLADHVFGSSACLTECLQAVVLRNAAMFLLHSDGLTHAVYMLQGVTVEHQLNAIARVQAPLLHPDIIISYIRSWSNDIGMADVTMLPHLSNYKMGQSLIRWVNHTVMGQSLIRWVNHTVILVIWGRALPGRKVSQVMLSGIKASQQYALNSSSKQQQQ